MNPALRTALLLSAQRALLGEVPPSLRGVSLHARDDALQVVFYFDGPVAAEDRESASCVASGMAADFPRLRAVDQRIERVDAPAPLPPDAVWAYRRRESPGGGDLFARGSSG